MRISWGGDPGNGETTRLDRSTTCRYHKSRGSMGCGFAVFSTLTVKRSQRLLLRHGNRTMARRAFLTAKCTSSSTRWLEYAGKMRWHLQAKNFKNFNKTQSRVKAAEHLQVVGSSSAVLGGLKSELFQQTFSAKTQWKKMTFSECHMSKNGNMFFIFQKKVSAKNKRGCQFSGAESF
jgi:hypothetical protein